MRAARMVQHLKKYSNEDRFRCLNMPTFKYRRLRGGIIQVYNIVSGKYNTQYPTVKFNLPDVSNTRGNMYKLQLTHTHYNLRKNFFSNKIVTVWNSLPNIVVSAESTNIFKSRLDKLWLNEEFKFDFRADFKGIGIDSVMCKSAYLVKKRT